MLGKEKKNTKSFFQGQGEGVYARPFNDLAERKRKTRRKGENE